MSDFYKNPQRKRNMYDPGSNQPFKLSRSKIDLFISCSRCFYIDRRLGVGRPPGFPFNLNTAVDTLLKQEFDVHRAENTGDRVQKFGDAAAPRPGVLVPVLDRGALLVTRGFGPDLRRLGQSGSQTLFAGEPDVRQPIAFCIGDRGRLWVAEAYNYPHHGTRRGDRILIFEDADGDGRFDKRTVFYDKLN